MQRRTLQASSHWMPLADCCRSATGGGGPLPDPLATPPRLMHAQRQCPTHSRRKPRPASSTAHRSVRHLMVHRHRDTHRQAQVSPTKSEGRSAHRQLLTIGGTPPAVYSLPGNGRCLAWDPEAAGGGEPTIKQRVWTFRSRGHAGVHASSVKAGPAGLQVSARSNA